jgi:hypothetical protein
MRTAHPHRKVENIADPWENGMDVKIIVGVPAQHMPLNIVAEHLRMDDRLAFNPMALFVWHFNTARK